jgi:hypothetical protein
VPLVRRFVQGSRSFVVAFAGSLRFAPALGVAALGLGMPASLHAAQLSSDARSAIPREVQQLIVVDYRAMQNSPAAMNLKERIMPPELKRLESSLRNSGLKVDKDTDTLAFAAFRTGGANDAQRLIGVAQGQFHTREVLAALSKEKIKPLMVRSNAVYPMGTAGMSVSFLDQTTMVFGDRAALLMALDARDGMIPNLLQNSEMMSEMNLVDSKAIWSILDQKGTQNMMKSVLGQASQLADYDTVRNRMKTSRYTIDFSNGVKFNMGVVMSDSITAATAATLMKGMALVKKTSGSPLERSALDDTTIDSTAGVLMVDYAAPDSQFVALLESPLFKQVVK